MATFLKLPYPITIEKMKVFLTYQAQNDTTINTLKAYKTSLSHCFKENNLEILTLTNDFQNLRAVYNNHSKKILFHLQKQDLNGNIFKKFLI